jgi:hypothetical protein
MPDRRQAILQSAAAKIQSLNIMSTFKAGEKLTPTLKTLFSNSDQWTACAALDRGMDSGPAPRGASRNDEMTI